VVRSSGSGWLSGTQGSAGHAAQPVEVTDNNNNITITVLMTMMMQGRAGGTWGTAQQQAAGGEPHAVRASKHALLTTRMPSTLSGDTAACPIDRTHNV
jgi:hypothetical protein